MILNIENFQLKQQIQAAQKQLEILQQASSQFPPPEELLAETVGTIAELTILLEDIQIATEELQQQSGAFSGSSNNGADKSRSYQQLSELTSDAYLVTNTKQIIQEGNSAATTLLNTNQRLLLRKPIILFVAKEERKTFYEKLRTLTRWEESKKWEMRLQPLKDKPFPVEVTVGTIHDTQDKLVGFRWLIRDITERKQAEQTSRELEAERELNELKSRFIQIVSHEFRTPLTVILSSSEMLEKYSDRINEEKKAQHFQKIRNSVGHTTQLLDDILVLSKAEAEKLAFNPQLLDLEQFCWHLVEEYQLIAASKHQIHFTAQGKSPHAYLDEKLLRQIFGNLLSNALKYSPQGGVIRLTLTCEDDKAIFQIQDQGIGIPPEDQKHLFEPFHRASNIATIPGTGLGLAISKRAIDLHRGAIAVESAVGVGTTFTVTLPLNQAKPVESQN